MMICACCERRAAYPCDCTAGTACLNCFRCERHCGCPFDLREIVFEEDAEPVADAPVIVSF